MSDRIEVNTESLQCLFDALVSSMDFGSGFLDTPEVEALREIAVVLGVDPNKATPAEHVGNYPHPWTYKTYGEPGDCGQYHCRRPKHDPIHINTTNDAPACQCVCHYIEGKAGHIAGRCCDRQGEKYL